MKFAVASLALITSVLAGSDIVSYEYETVTNTHSTEVTITSCADNECVTTVQSVTNTVVTTTVDGIETVYTTICPLTESHSMALTSEAPIASSMPTSLAAESVIPSSLEEIIYVDITTTPVVTASTGVESTVYQQSTFTSIYNSNSSSYASVSWANDAPRNFFAGAAGVAGVAALLL